MTAVSAIETDRAVSAIAPPIEPFLMVNAHELPDPGATPTAILKLVNLPGVDIFV